MQSNTDILFNFPRVKFVDENNIYAQAAHIQTEADEAFRELATSNIEALAMETMDCLHSCETMLRILSEKHGVNITKIMFAVYEKNEQRGYYE